MSISLQRNEITLLDGYNLNPKRDSKKPLIQQLTTDLLNNGFEDVGPQLTKITISEESIAKFVDEFIVWHYDSSLLSASEGAFGVADAISDSFHFGRIVLQELDILPSSSMENLVEEISK